MVLLTAKFLHVEEFATVTTLSLLISCGLLFWSVSLKNLHCETAFKFFQFGTFLLLL
jgi:hypothetical protein